MSHYDDLQELLLKRSILYPNSEIYNAVGGFYDYGSVGTVIKQRWENLWRKFFLSLNDNFHEIETSLIMPEAVFKGSGHLDHFNDPVAECSKCKTQVRADHILEEFLGLSFEGSTPEELNAAIKKHKVVCPKCKSEFKNIIPFTLMFPLTAGSSAMYLRPETAQGPYTAFKREFKTNRERLPLGLAMIGKAFRNEISPRQLVIRQREFTQAELQIFFNPNDLPKVPFEEVEDQKLTLHFAGKEEPITISAREAISVTGMDEFFVYFMAKDQQFMESLGFGENFKFVQLSDEEKAFYNKYHWDLKVLMPSFDKWVEVAGFHYRTDHDLQGHQKVSKTKLAVSVNGEKFVPHVLELSFGVDRNVFALLDCNLKKNKEGAYLALPKAVAPYDVGVYPLVKKESLPEKAKGIVSALRSSGFRVYYDEGGSIGKRYARADEIGVPYGITIDFDSLKDETVTIRDRDTTEQQRVHLKDLIHKLSE